MSSKKSIFALASTLLVLTFSLHAGVPGAIDRGPMTAFAATTPISVTISLALPHLSEAEALAQAIYTPGGPQYHRFITAEQFATSFGPTDADFAKAIRGFAKFNLSAQKTSATTIIVTGMPADLERAFSVVLHGYEVPANGKVPGYTYHAPLNSPIIPAEVGVAMAGMAGLDSRPAARSHIKRLPEKIRAKTAASASTSTGNPPGLWTVLDFAKYYDVNPLYQQGVTGAGRTIGIMTLASFTPSDAFDYWSTLGLKVAKNRIRVVNIDGGPGAPSDVSGSDETTLDVEQSGGIAPAAKIIVYQAPNTTQGFVDLFAKAIDDNAAESLSISWGEWEWLANYENAAATDPTTGKTVSTTRAIHELLLRAALQGQSTFAAAGDGGAYDANNSYGCLPPYSASDPSSCTLALSVDYPASDSLITASGGTTLAGTQEFCLNQTCTATYSVTVQHERVWGWDYLNGLCKALGYSDPISCGTFPAGGGGGVSVSFPVPFYQFGIPGVELSQPGQLFKAAGDPTLGLPAANYSLPAYFAGRNVPDISFNADPDTGYVLFYTSDMNGFAQTPYAGGTSFVAPQLNGVTALLGEYTHDRIGLLNPAVYGLDAAGAAYKGTGAPLNAIKYGDNWFYHGSNGYNPAAGLGTLDVANFAEWLKCNY